ncbi:MAG: hypothetical protein KDA31_11210 [Phycisphaerales bacterium]|nr:hypothetical protein [Phycisphaerales bacterium]MCB9836562.1 hypothetical protein [Phycisphaera sp.]
MMRRILTIALFLFIGAVLSVLVAWGCETFSGESIVISYEQPAAPFLMPGIYDPPEDWTVQTWVRFKGLGVRGAWTTEMLWAGSTLGMSSDSTNRIRIRHYSGWPLLCMVRSDPFDSDLGIAAKGDVWAVGFEPPWASRIEPRYRGKNLPLRPMPVRFAANSVFWGFVAWICTFGAWRYRRWNRIRRGLCIRCKYELAGLETCPECGTSARPRRMEA